MRLLPLAILAACAGAPETSTKVADPAPAAEAAPEAAPETAPAAESWVVTPLSAGPLSAATQADLAAVQGAFPDFVATEATTSSEGAVTGTSIELRDGDTLVAIVIPKGGGRIGRAEFYDDRFIAMAEGLGVGSRLGDVGGLGSLSCQPGREELSGSVICSVQGIGHLRWVGGGAWDGPDGSMPPADVMREYRVSRLVWLPDPNVPDGARIMKAGAAQGE